MLVGWFLSPCSGSHHVAEGGGRALYIYILGRRSGLEKLAGLVAGAVGNPFMWG